jgi:hypothetical protein
MNAHFQKVVVALALSGVCFAQTTTTTTRKKTATKTHAAAKRPPAATTEDLQRLQESMQQQIDQLKQQIADKDQKLQQVQQQLSDTQAASQQAQQKASSVETLVTDQKAKTDADLNDVRGTLTSTVQTIQEGQKKFTEMTEHPTAVHYKGVTITPGGFLVAEGMWRSRTEQTDVISSFNGVPFNGSPQSHMTEFRGSARQSRLSLLVEGKVGSAKLSGYYEMDFLGAAPTANENQSTSFNPRQRQLFGQVAFDSGWTITGGQQWSLITTNKKGIQNRGEWVPSTIDGQYIVGYHFARLMSARVTKAFANNKATVGFSIENPAYLFGGTVPAGVITTLPGTGTLGNGNNYSVNLAPDMIGKVAFDPGWGHFEFKALGRVFRNRVPTGVVGLPAGTPTGNNTEWGGGGGFGMILPFTKKVDFIAQGLAGYGVARYVDSSNVDIVVRPTDGHLNAVDSLSGAAGFELHPSPKLDIYLYGGTEYLGRNYSYGASTNNYTACFAPETTFSCSANFKNLYQGTAGFWYRFYKGAYGTLQYGLQGSYTNKASWDGVNRTVPTAPVVASPTGNNTMVFTSFRYYIP